MADSAWKLQKTTAEIFNAKEMQMQMNRNELAMEISVTTTKEFTFNQTVFIKKPKKQQTILKNVLK